MKKLLYLVPLLLIGLSATPISLYKDKVDFLLAKNPNAKVEAGALTALSPSHWKMLSYSVNASVNLDSSSVTVTTDDSSDSTQTTQQPKTEPLYKGATFHGFPFAAYFSKDSSNNSGGFSSSFSASGYSWLWATIDALLIIVSLIVSFKVNRKKKEVVVAQSTQPTVPQTPVGAGTTEAIMPQSSTQAGVITPSQPPQPQTVQPIVQTPSQPTEPPQAPPQV